MKSDYIERKSYLIINTQFDNLGDGLILRELTRLAVVHGNVVLYVKRTPRSFVDILLSHPEVRDSVALKPRGWYLAACLDMLRDRATGTKCFYFLTPGGLNGEKSRLQFVNELVRLAVVAALALVGVRVCQVGISLERIGPRHARLLRWRSRFLTVCAPRDVDSAEYATMLGIRTTAIAPDLALSLFSSGIIEGSPKRRDIALTFRVDKDPIVKDRVESIALHLLGALGPDTGLLCVAQVERDAEYMRAVCKKLSKDFPDRVKFVDVHSSFEDAVFMYSTCRLVVANRLHALLLGMHAGAAPLALVSPLADGKIVGVFKSLGILDHVYDIDMVSDVTKLADLVHPSCYEGAFEAGQALEEFFDEIFGDRALR